MYYFIICNRLASKTGNQIHPWKEDIANCVFKFNTILWYNHEIIQNWFSICRSGFQKAEIKTTGRNTCTRTSNRNALNQKYQYYKYSQITPNSINSCRSYAMHVIQMSRHLQQDWQSYILRITSEKGYPRPFDELELWPGDIGVINNQSIQLSYGRHRDRMS